MKAQAGFSLIELIIVIVVVAIAAVAIGSAFAYISRSQGLDVNLQAATQLAQECADHIMGLARKPGTYGSVPLGGTACDALPPEAGRAVNVTAMPTGGTLCSGAGWGCKRVDITVTRGNATVTLNFMLVNY